MGKKKIFNDPIYGLISFPAEILYDLIDHPYFQRLRRISQTGMAHYVYPGAHHTRFQHALGALHLMTKAINSLRSKSVVISDQEAEAVCIAILLHDIGHGPYSHALEMSIIDLNHEEISLLYMEELNKEFNGKLDLALKIFKGIYNKPYLHELVSSQLDMDRMDYLIRDSYFTGVAEGVIGYDRLIKMLNVVDGHLVIEEKGIYSVEKFLIARRLMYWQVYLHKTALGVEKMLTSVLNRVKYLVQNNIEIQASNPLLNLLKYKTNLNHKELVTKDLLSTFNKIDDIDILDMIKRNIDHDDYILSYICQSLIKRQLFKVYLSPEKISSTKIAKVQTEVEKKLSVSPDIAKTLVTTGFEKNLLYDTAAEEIRILKKDGLVDPFSVFSDLGFNLKSTGKHYICFPN